VGMAFQIIDDCLDLTGETRHLGKTTGLDLYKNDVTLPLLYLFHEIGEDRRHSILEALKHETNGIFEEIKVLALEKKVVERSMEKAREYAEAAAGELACLGDSAYKESLTSLTQYCLERVR